MLTQVPKRMLHRCVAHFEFVPMRTSGARDRLEIDGAFHHGGAQVDYAISMIPIGDEGVPNSGV